MEQETRVRTGLSSPCVCVYAHACIRVCFPSGSDDKEFACNAGDLGSIPGSGNPPEKGIATHSSILS